MGELVLTHATVLSRHSVCPCQGNSEDRLIPLQLSTPGLLSTSPSLREPVFIGPFGSFCGPFSSIYRRPGVKFSFWLFVLSFTLYARFVLCFGGDNYLDTACLVYFISRTVTFSVAAFPTWWAGHAALTNVKILTITSVVYLNMPSRRVVGKVVLILVLDWSRQPINKNPDHSRLWPLFRARWSLKIKLGYNWIETHQSSFFMDVFIELVVCYGYGLYLDFQSLQKSVLFPAPTTT